MTQHDFTLDNQTFPSFRSDLNSGLQALATNSSGSSAPGTTFAYQWWVDTTNGLIKIRNAANSAWITVGVVDQTGLWVMTRSGTPQGNIAGTFLGQLALDTSANKMYACTTTGNAASAVWSNSPFSNVPQGFIYGCQPSPNASTPTTKIDIAIGAVVDSGNTTIMTVGSPLTVDIGASAGANAIDTGSKSNSTWYYLWVIGKTDGTVAGLFSASSSSPTMPSGYTLKRLIGAHRIDGSGNFIKTKIAGGSPTRPFFMFTEYEDQSAFNVLSAGTATTFTGVSMTGLVPPISTFVRLFTYTTYSSAIRTTVLRKTGSGLTNGFTVGNTKGGVDNFFFLDMETDTSQSIDYKISGAGTTLSLYVNGYYLSL